MIGFSGPALLFCPADRPDRFEKAAGTADVVILDLEDGVASADRPRARKALREVPLDPDRTVVRVNPAGTPDQAADLAALAPTAYRTVMLAKAEEAQQIASLAAALTNLGSRATDPGNQIADRGHRSTGAANDNSDSGTVQARVIALCETARGVLHAAAIAAEPATLALMWGAEDLLVSLGGRSSRDSAGRYRDIARHARNTVLLAAGAYGRLAIDSVFLDLADGERLSAEAEDAAASGFAAKACIHPSQVEPVRAAFRPTGQELAWARRVLRVAEHSAGVFRFEGRMVDEPILAQARRIIEGDLP